jgi:pyruvate dehydrogenase E1 component alpha subunit
MSDPGLSYRTRDEIADMRKSKDPIEILKRFILEGKLATEDQLKKIDREARDVVEKAIEDARAAPFPQPEEVFTDIFIHPKEEKCIPTPNGFTLLLFTSLHPWY